MKYIALCLLALIPVLMLNAETFSVKSPDGKNEIQLFVGDELQYSVLRNGITRVVPAAIGMTIEGKGTLGVNPEVIDSRKRAVKSVIKTPIYKKSEINGNGNELTVSFAGNYKVVFRAFNDGVAYRFATAFGGPVKVMDENASIAFPYPDLTAYVGYNWGNRDDPKQDKLQNSWESIYEKTTVSDIAADKTRLIYLPLLLEYKDGVCMCVTESDLLDYPGWNLYRKGGDKTKLSPWMAKYPVHESEVNNQRQIRIKEREPWLAQTKGTREYPWRVFIMADQPAELVESDIVYALATPHDKPDGFSWVKPGKVAWDWWNKWNVSGVDFRAGCNTATYEYYIDFAEKNNIEYVIFDEGWSVKLKIMEIHPDVDVPHLIRYAAERGVGIILWCSWPQLVGRQHEVFKRYADMGAVGFKIDFMDRDDQFVVNFLEKTAAIAAEYKLIVDYHGMFKPTGLQRTWPNVLNFEGVHGLEQLKWEKGSDFPANDCKIIFTRMVAGPLDYTPGSMRNQTKKGFTPNFSQPSSQGTRVHQLALMSLFEAPLQMLCDSPTLYMRNQECTDFMVKVPTVWDETIGLAGDVDAYAAIARRKGNVWYVSAISNWEARELTLDLSFIEGKYRAEIFADGINADRDATDYTHSFQTISGGTKLKIKMAPGGGWTARLVPESI
ncbi:MAG: glycoside hydrolase family 97 protein [Kiritimatiellia bacterium]